MSHAPQREEKDCLNCGTIVQGHYCHHCGQENIVRHEGFWQMVKHFFYDITHFDSKFFDTLKDLLFKPGFLSKEYVNGKRASYLHPVKMYVFTSAVFFLLFFSFFNKGGNINTNLDDIMTKEERIAEIESAEKEIKKDSANKKLAAMVLLLKDSTRELKKSDLVQYWDGFDIITIGAGSYKTYRQYDSVQAAMPAEKRDGWLGRQLVKKAIQVNDKYRNDPANAFKKMQDGFLHKLPYMLFVSLPLFALILKLLFIRRKDFYYFDHAVFSIHHYIFSFILLAMVFSLSKLSDLLHSDIFTIVAIILFLSGGFYLYKAMRRFYEQRRAKTVIKFLLLNIAGLIGMILLFTIFVVFSIFEL